MVHLINGFNNIMLTCNLSGTLVVYGEPNQNHEKTIDGVSIGSESAEGRITFKCNYKNVLLYQMLISGTWSESTGMN